MIVWIKKPWTAHTCAAGKAQYTLNGLCPKKMGLSFIGVTFTALEK